MKATRELQPEIAAQALYELSFCYENLGDEARVMASLMDAKTFKEHLAPEQALAEIPARLAASFNRIGRTKEAHENYLLAEVGVKEIRGLKSQNVSPEWLSKLYYNMGAFSTNQISQESLQGSLDTLKMVQIFSLRSIEAQGKPWAKMAEQGLITNYRDIWNTIEMIPLNPTLDSGAAKRDKMERQIAMTGKLLAISADLKLQRAPDEGENEIKTSALFDFLKELEIKGQALLASQHEMTPLTPEALQREGLKRKGLKLKNVNPGENQ